MHLVLSLDRVEETTKVTDGVSYWDGKRREKEVTSLSKDTRGEKNGSQ